MGGNATWERACSDSALIPPPTQPEISASSATRPNSCQIKFSRLVNLRRPSANRPNDKNANGKLLDEKTQTQTVATRSTAQQNSARLVPRRNERRTGHPYDRRIIRHEMRDLADRLAPADIPATRCRIGYCDGLSAHRETALCRTANHLKLKHFPQRDFVQV
jgi:hypothetical protein